MILKLVDMNEGILTRQEVKLINIPLFLIVNKYLRKTLL